MAFRRYIFWINQLIYLIKLCANIPTNGQRLFSRTQPNFIDAIRFTSSQKFPSNPYTPSHLFHPVISHPYAITVTIFGCRLAVPVPRSTHLAHLLSQPIPSAHIDLRKKTQPQMSLTMYPHNPTCSLIGVFSAS